MASPLAEKAIIEAQQYGRAILKFISANDAGLTGSHQAGFYLPKPAWKMYAPFGPVKGTTEKSKVKIVWQGSTYETDSVVTWYGEKTRKEYRLTCFGRDFPFLDEDTVGNLLVLIPQDMQSFLAYVIDLPDDIQDIQNALGVETLGAWAVYDAEAVAEELSEEDCIDKQFRHFAASLSAFPEFRVFSEKTREALLTCGKSFGKKPADDRLLALMQSEFKLFRLAERQLCFASVKGVFKDVDDFVKTASSIMNRRRSRPARSIENHVEFLLKDAHVPFDVRRLPDGDPSLIIPGKPQYDDPTYPADRLFVVGVRYTCKGRWWQITQDSSRVQWKHLITMQEGVSASQLEQMHKAKVALVVPKKFQNRYPKVSGVNLLNVEGFVKQVKRKLGH